MHRIKFYNKEKGFGFIYNDSDPNEKDVFFYRDALGGVILDEDTPVAYTMKQGKRGPEASDIRAVGANRAVPRGSHEAAHVDNDNPVVAKLDPVIEKLNKLANKMAATGLPMPDEHLLIFRVSFDMEKLRDLSLEQLKENIEDTISARIPEFVAIADRKMDDLYGS